MTDFIAKAVEEVNALPTCAGLRAEWQIWQDECKAAEIACLRKQNAILEITLRAARKQVAEYHDKAREYANLAWNADSVYYKNRECNLANVAFESVERRLLEEISTMEAKQKSIKRKLKAHGVNLH